MYRIDIGHGVHFHNYFISTWLIMESKLNHPSEWSYLYYVYRKKCFRDWSRGRAVHFGKVPSSFLSVSSICERYCYQRFSRYSILNMLHLTPEPAPSDRHQNAYESLSVALFGALPLALWFEQWMLKLTGKVVLSSASALSDPAQIQQPPRSVEIHRRKTIH